MAKLNIKPYQKSDRIAKKRAVCVMKILKHLKTIGEK